MGGLGTHAQGWADVEQRSGLAWNGALHHQQIAITVHSEDGEPSRGDLLAAVTPSHALAGVDATRRCTSAGGAWFTVIFGTVRHRTATEAMTLLVTGKAASHRVAADVNLLAGFEVTHGDCTAEFQAVDVVNAVLTEVTEYTFAGFGEVPLGWFVDQLFAGVPEADLNGDVAVRFCCFELGDPARPRLDQSDRDGFALLVEELGHTQLLPKDADGHGR